MVDIKNVAIFMADSVRWNSHPAAISQMGQTVRTVASSLHTPSSIASMLTGRYLPNHGVRGFTDELDPELATVFGAFPNAGLSSESGSFNSEIYGRLLSEWPERSLHDIETPFAWFMRDPGGHAPYNGFDSELEPVESVNSFFDRTAGNRDALRDTYQDSIDSFVGRFESRVLTPLEERGILDDTLVIVVSDHGELLGEYGHVGQSFPACPEIVYVPMTLIHPDLPSVDPSIARHVDIFPTVLELRPGGDRNPETNDLGKADGVNLFDKTASINYGFSFYDRTFPSFRGQFSYRIDSVWDEQGGHAFNQSNLWAKSKLLLGYLSRIPAGIQLRRSRSLEGFRMLFENHREWGTPTIDVDEAVQMLEDFESTSYKELELEAETREHLEDMGYL